MTPLEPKIALHWNSVVDAIEGVLGVYGEKIAKVCVCKNAVERVRGLRFFLNWNSFCDVGFGVFHDLWFTRIFEH